MRERYVNILAALRERYVNVLAALRGRFYGATWALQYRNARESAPLLIGDCRVTEYCRL